jgi:serine/threonine-protein kinase
LDRKVAVKFLHVGGEHRRLLDELAALQRIRSKHVVEIFDVTYSRDLSMGIVQEFVDGADLQPLLGNVRSNEEFLRLLYQMSSGLADIHTVGIVHRDIKPSNIMIDGVGILKIIDFNLARPNNAAHTQGFVGTRGYAAPELYLDGRVDFDPKVDVYALGVTALALLKGEDLPRELLHRPPLSDAWREFAP